MVYRINLIFLTFINIFYVFRSIFVKMGVDSTIYFITGFLIMINAFYFIAKVVSTKKIRFIKSVGFYVILSVLLFLYTLLINPFFVDVIGYIALYGNFILWVLVIYNLKEKDCNNLIVYFLKINIAFGVLTAILGIYQFYIDSSIYGLVTNELYGNQELMESGRFVRRTTGLMGSPQNYAVYIAAITSLVFYSDLRKRTKYLSAVILITGGFLSGSRAYSLFIIIVLILSVLLNIFNKKDSAIKFTNYGILFIVLILTFFTFSRFEFESKTFGRLFTFFSDWPALNVYKQKLLDLDYIYIFMGNGLGYNERLVAMIFNTSYYSFESFLLSLFMQSGFIGALGFLVVFFSSLKQSLQFENKVYFSMLIGIFINILVTPSFNGLAISFLFWPLIIWPIRNKLCPIRNIGNNFKAKGRGIKYYLLEDS